MSDLDNKQRRFVSEYLKDQNGTQAAIRAGYSAKTAQEQASRLLSKVMVKDAVEAGLSRVQEQAGITASFVLNSLKEVAERCMQGVPVRIKQGNEWVETGEWEFDSSGANRSLELLGKHLGLFEDGQRGDDDGRNPYVKLDPSQFGQFISVVDRELASRKISPSQGTGMAA